MSIVPYTTSSGTNSSPAQRGWIALMAPAVELAKAVSNTEFVPKSLRGNPAAITAAILYGDEVGLGPMQSLARIAVIDGKPTLAAEAQRALILAAGHDIWIEEASTTRVTVAGKRRDSDQTSRFTWTMDDAKRANLAGRPAWRAYPRQMLLARASAELARALFADAIGGLAATEELDEPTAAAANPEGSAAVAEPPTSRRRRRTTSATISSPATEQPKPEPPPGPPLPGEPEPEAVAEPPPEPEPAGISEPQRKKLMAIYRQRGFDDRDQRLAFATFIVQRPITSSNDLTMDEASRLIDVLEKQGPPLPDEEPSQGELPEDF